MNKNCTGDWFKLICNSYEGDSLYYKDIKLPKFPDEQLQINTVGQSGKDALCEAYIFYDDCINVFKQSNNFVNNDKTILDFGVAWGRILRFFIKDFMPKNLYGVDINTDFLDICKQTFDFGNFIKSNAFPPINVPDESMDFIVGYSVFSHLSEDACLEWIKEFKRILKPGGMLALTTRGRWFMDYCESLKSVQGYTGALSNLFDDFDAAKKQYDKGEFVFTSGDGVSGGGPLNESFYGEAFIPEEYVREVYSKYFNVIDFQFTSGRQSHPIIFLQK